MMQRIIYAAIALLIIQVGLVVAINRGGGNLEAVTPETRFVEFNPKLVTGVEITDSDNQQLSLTKDGEEWLISSAFSAPADKELVDKLLSKLADAKQGFAIATTKGAAARFKTAEDDFERHIVINKGDQVAADFYLGTGAGMRNSHARRSEEQEVFTLPLSSFEVEAMVENWLDKKRFQLDTNDLKSLQLADIQLEKGKNGWQLAGNDALDVKPDEIDDLVNALGSLDMQSVLDPAETKSLFDADPDFEFTVSTDKRTDVRYAFVKKDDDNVLKISDIEFYFKVSEWQLNSIKEYNREKLVQPNENTEETENVEMSE